MRARDSDGALSARCRSVLVLMAVLLTASLAQAGQQEEMTVQDGVYTQEQADRGRAHYQTHCEVCHGPNLSGANARALAGDDFLSFWAGLSLEALFERVQSMPPGGGSSLGQNTYVELLALLLDHNGLPPGGAPLAPDGLDNIMIEGEDGPRPAADFSLVQVVGCLARGPNDSWVVTHASEPRRTRAPEGSEGDALTVAQEIALGHGSFGLLYVYPDPTPFAGHRVEAKGFLIREPEDQINVTGFQSLANTCAP